MAFKKFKRIENPIFCVCSKTSFMNDICFWTNNVDNMKVGKYQRSTVQIRVMNEEYVSLVGYLSKDLCNSMHIFR